MHTCGGVDFRFDHRQLSLHSFTPWMMIVGCNFLVLYLSCCCIIATFIIHLHLLHAVRCYVFLSIVFRVRLCTVSELLCCHGSQADLVLTDRQAPPCATHPQPASVASDAVFLSLLLPHLANRHTSITKVFTYFTKTLFDRLYHRLSVILGQICLETRPAKIHNQ